jgi:hypothetical protein
MGFTNIMAAVPLSFSCAITPIVSSKARMMPN